MYLRNKVSFFYFFLFFIFFPGLTTGNHRPRNFVNSANAGLQTINL